MSCSLFKYHVSLHLGMFKRMPDQLLYASANCNCASKTWMVDVTRVASLAYNLLDKERLFDVIV